MAKSIFEVLFYGKEIPWERRVPHSHEREEIEKQIQNEKAYLKGELPTEAHSHLEMLENLYTHATTDEEVDIFSRGFIMGALIMLEVMSCREDILNG